MRRRPWQGWEDLAPMQQLLARALRDTPDIAFLHPGDLAWWVGWPRQTHEELAAKVTIVEDGGRIVGWHYIDRDDVNEWVDEAAADADAAWRELDMALEPHPGLARSRRDDDEAGVARLRSSGYTPMDEGMIGFSIDLRELDDVDADDRVRPVAIGDDLRPRASVTKAAFGVDKPFDRYVEEYEAFTRSPAYPHGSDLVAWTDDGRAAACTIAWADPVSRVGNFEPVAAHPDVRRQGYATAVLREGFRRLRDAGMERAVVYTPIDNEPAIALYRSVGFRDDHIQRWFARS
ncbi:MAG: GNAT family N-acetyltransferase [Actinomycetota bacterium]